MQEQSAFPFYECAEDATNSAILRSGKPFKQVAAFVRPEISQDSAYAWLKNALRDDTREKLSADQHILIANFVEQYDYLYYAASKCHHSKPEPVSPADEMASLQQDIIKGQQALTQALNRYNSLRAGVK